MAKTNGWVRVCKHSAEQVLVCWDGASVMLQPSGREGNSGSLLIVLRCNRLHRFVKSGNSVAEEVMVMGLKSMGCC